MQYCDNKKLSEALQIYNEEINKLPHSLKFQEASDYLGETIIMIADRLSRRNNFRNYIFKDELVEEAVIAMSAALLKFDTNKSKNAFSYLTTIAFNSFVKHIQAEKGQLYCKFKHIEEQMIESQSNSELSEIASACSEYCNKESDIYFREYLRKYEDSLVKRVAKYKKHNSSLSDFWGE